MIEKVKILELVRDKIDGTDKYLVDLRINQGNIINVIIDGDSLVSIEDCIAISRHIESGLDRDKEDFELRVSSFGADKPIMLKRQYRKNIGRELEILLVDDKRISGKLEDVTEDNIRIIPTEIKGKRKTFADKTVTLKFNEIKEAKIILSFK